jgi:hypothetical protein
MQSPTFFKKTILVSGLLLFASYAISQQTDSTKAELNFSGSVTANNNGFSLVPTFSLGKPAIQTGFNISGKKGRFTFHPQFWYSMLDYKPWSFIFIWRYKLVRKEKFEFILGTHAPAINFKSATVTEDGEEMDIIKARRFYPALEVLPIYQLNKNISLSMYGIFGRGIEEEVATTNYFLSFRTDFNDIPLTKQLFLRLNPQIYYLRIGGDDGFYTAAGLTLAHRKWPLSIGTMMNKALKSEIDVKEFDWNVSLTYAFGKTFVER